MDELLNVTLAGGKDAPRLARTALRGLNGSLAELRFRVTLLVSELVTKAVTHGATGSDGTFSVRMDAGPDRVHAEVAGAGAGLEAPPGRPIDPIEDGFGLALLDELSDRWGVDGEDETTVWFEIDHTAGRRKPREASGS